MRPNQQNNNKNRSRGRNNNGGRKHGNPLSRNYESNGPDVKVRGNAAHVAEKYLQLARDAQSSGDSVMAENYLQHAEHYFRIISAAQQAQQAQFRGEAATEEDDYDDDFTPINDRFASPEPRAPFQPQQQNNGGNGNNNGNQQQPPQQQYVDQQPQGDAVEAAAAEPQAKAEGNEAQAAEGDGTPRRRDRRPRRRSRGGGGSGGEGGAEGSDPGNSPQPDIGLPAFLTAGNTPAE
jgi:hypothetical protein